MFRRFFTIISFFIGLFSAGQSQELSLDEPISLPLRTVFSPHQYQGGIQNWNIKQDSLGFIYVANNYGLLEYDGARWIRHSLKNQTKLRSLFIAPNNIIYTGGQNQLGYYSKSAKGLSYSDLKPSLPAEVSTDEVWKFFDLDGKVFANLINSIIYIKNNDEIEVIEGLKTVGFATIIDSDLYVNSTDGGIYKLDDSHKLHLLPGSELFDEDLRMGFTKHGKIFFISYQGSIFEYHNGQLRPIETELGNFLKVAKINHGIELSNGSLALATQNDGLIIINKDFKLLHHYTKNRGLSHRTVLSLHEDQFENLWVGLNNGIDVIELGSPFNLINEEIGLEGTGYCAIAYNGAVLYGTSSGLFHVHSKQSSTGKGQSYYTLIEGSEGLVNNLSTIENQIFVSHHEGGFILKDGRMEQIIEDAGTWDFKKIDDKTVLAGTYQGLQFLRKKDNEWKLHYEVSDLKESSRIFEFTNDTTLWMTQGYKGAYKISLNQNYDHTYSIKKYGKNKGFPSNILISVYEINDELLFTSESGIFTYHLQSDQFYPHQFLNQWFENQHVSKLSQKANHLIFYIAEGELGYIREQTIGVFEQVNNSFKKVNRYINNDLENINIIDDENVLIGAKEGFIHYSPNRDIRLPKEFHTYLRELTWVDRTDSSHARFGPLFGDPKIKNPKSVRFMFATPYFDGIDRIEYSYKLSPYDKEWSEWSLASDKEFTNLSPGNYTFHVRARNVYGEVSTVSATSFELTPRWFESSIAYIAYVCILLFLFGLLLYNREKKHTTEKHKIHLSKEEEIRLKEEEINAFSEETHQRIQALKNENLKKELDHKNSQLTSVTMHLLSKNEFVRSVRKKLHEALKDIKHTSEINKIIQSIDKNIQQDDGWDTFAYHFDQVHEDFLKKLNQKVKLTPQETKLCAYLRMNMSTKDIANMMNITVRGVELARYRLRKKLELERDTHLNTYLSDI